MTQEQANAIAESVFPYPELFANDQWTHKDACARIDTRRWAYAKCLMDLNPLIEAVSGYERELKNPAVDLTMRPYWRNKMFAALSNLTKNI